MVCCGYPVTKANKPYVCGGYNELASIQIPKAMTRPFTSTVALGLTVFLGWTAVHGQTNCAKDNLIGEWKKVKNIPTTSANIDSLKNLALSSNDTLSILHLNSDSTYTYDYFGLDKKSGRFTLVIDKKRKRFTFDANKCEIILGTTRTARKNGNLEVIYLDDKFLIFREDNNPKDYFTHILVKK